MDDFVGAIGDGIAGFVTNAVDAVGGFLRGAVDTVNHALPPGGLAILLFVSAGVAAWQLARR